MAFRTSRTARIVAELEKGIAKIISYGSPFVANTDLPKRFELNAELNLPDPATMYGGGKNFRFLVVNKSLS